MHLAGSNLYMVFFESDKISSCSKVMHNKCWFSDISTGKATCFRVCTHLQRNYAFPSRNAVRRSVKCYCTLEVHIKSGIDFPDS